MDEWHQLVERRRSFERDVEEFVVAARARLDALSLADLESFKVGGCEARTEKGLLLSSC